MANANLKAVRRLVITLIRQDILIEYSYNFIIIIIIIININIIIYYYYYSELKVRISRYLNAYFALQCNIIQSKRWRANTRNSLFDPSIQYFYLLVNGFN